MKHLYTNHYELTNGATRTILNFVYDGYIFGTDLTSELLHDRVRISRESTAKGGNATLKLNKLTNPQRVALIASGNVKMICSVEYAEKIRKENGFVNMGCAVEHIYSITNNGNGFQKGDNRPYYECGDVIINGEQVQIKYEAASLARVDLIEKIYAERFGE